MGNFGMLTRNLFKRGASRVAETCPRLAELFFKAQNLAFEKLDIVVRVLNLAYMRSTLIRMPESLLLNAAIFFKNPFDLRDKVPDERSEFLTRMKISECVAQKR